ncbi:MAG: dihydrodipicolinate reductase C-terminal domain-containing protein [Chlamydiota bacterium]
MAKVVLIGYGKMGKKIAELAPSCKHEIIGRIHCARDDLAVLQQADVAIDFATCADPKAHFERILSWKTPVVIGATGWESHLPYLRKQVEKQRVGVLIGANFSMGLYRFRALLVQAAQTLKSMDRYDVAGVESHHKEKRDAPSGTAKQIKSDFAEQGLGELSFSSVRIGTAIGTHRVIFDSPEDTIELVHAAKDRAGFARGALAAAEWLIGKQGLVTFDDFMASNREVEVCS